MNTITKVIVALVVIVLIALGAYYMLADSPTGEMIDDLKTMTGDVMQDDSSSVAGSVAVPPATGSVDDFSAAMQAELDATAAAMQALDADVDAETDTVVNSGNNTYDPSNL